MLGLVKVKYNNLPNNLLNCVGFAKGLPSCLDNLKFCSIGNLTGLEPMNLVSFRISKAYFLWFKLIPASVLATLSPKKYLKDPRYFKPNLASSNFFKLSTKVGLFPVSNISSTYTKSTIKEEPCV